MADTYIIHPNQGITVVQDSDSPFENLTTDDLVEGSLNLYYTAERAQSDVLSRIFGGTDITIDYDSSNQTLVINSTASGGGGPSLTDTDDLAEGSTNLYYTDERAQDAFGNILTLGSNLSGGYDDSSDVYNVDIDFGSFDTDDIAEGSLNRYYTDSRARSALSASGDLSYNPATGEFSVTTYKSSDFDADFALKTTDDLPEGSTNLYYTDARVSANPDVSANTAARHTQNTDTGTTSQTFAVDSDEGSHVLLKNNAGSLEIRNESDTGFTDLTVENLTVEGTTTSVNSNIVSIADNIITLNSDESGTPSEDAGIEVKRGTETNASFIWNESTDTWQSGLQGSEVNIATSNTAISTFTNDAGYITTYTVTESDVTQHESALTITESQISDLNHYDSTDFSVDFSGKTTDDLTEGSSNLYYTSERAQDSVFNAISAGTNITVNYDDSAGVFTINAIVNTFNGTTDDVPEGSTNLYFTEERVDDRVGSLLTAGTNVSISYDDSVGTITISSTDTNTTYSAGTLLTLSGTTFNVNDDLSLYDNSTSGFITDYTVTESDVTQHEVALTITESQISDLDHYTSSDFDTDFSSKSTDDLSEGSTNVYWTQARFDTAFLNKDTDDLGEGTFNRYYTAERAQDDVLGAVVAGNNITLNYDDSANTLTISAIVDDFVGTTDDVSEGSTNLYYLAERAQDDVFNNIIGGTEISVNYNDSAGTFTIDFVGTHYTSADFNTDFAGKTTDDLSEGSGSLFFTDERAQDSVFNNIIGGTEIGVNYNDSANTFTINFTGTHYTSSDFDNDFSGKTTDDLTEGGSNLYYTEARVSANSDVSANTAARHTQNTDTGTTSNTFEIESGAASHVLLKNDTGVLRVRNQADSQDADLIVENLTVNGTQTTINSETLSIADNEILLNSDVSGTPIENAGLEVERGTETNAAFIWDEANGEWKAGLVGSETTIALITDNLSEFNNDLDTDDIPEGSTNLYYTVERAQDDTLSNIVGGTEISVNYDDSAGTLTVNFVGTHYSSSDFDSDFSGKTTDDLAEGSVNLYYEAERAQDDVFNNIVGSGATFVSYDDSANTFTISSTDTDTTYSAGTLLSLSGTTFNVESDLSQYDNSASGFISNISGFTTDDLSEGSGNLYFTDERAQDAVFSSATIGGTGINFAYDDSANIGTFAIDFNEFSTDDINEGSTNLYFTDSRVINVVENTAITFGDDVTFEGDVNITNLTLSTDEIAEGSGNLFFTDERAQDAVFTSIIGGTEIDVTYNDSANTFTIDFVGTHYTSSDFDTDFSLKSTDELNEGSVNRYFTEERAQDAAASMNVGGTGIQGLYDDSVGTYTFSIDFSEFDTDDIVEGSSNLFFTAERTQDATFTNILGGNEIDTTYDDSAGTLTIDFVGTHYTSSDFGTDFSGKSTDDLSEGSTNLYYTESRVSANSDVSANTAERHTQNTDTGTTNDTFAIESSLTPHVLLKNDNGALRLRNQADSQDANLIVENLTVNGTQTVINSETLTIADNQIVLNSDVSGTPVEEAGIEVERGTETNASLIWDEANDLWKAGLFGSETEIALITESLSTFNNDLTSDDIIEGSVNRYFTEERAQDSVGSIINGGIGITATYDDSSPQINVELDFGEFTTDDIPEGSTNTYYSDTSTLRFYEFNESIGSNEPIKLVDDGGVTKAEKLVVDVDLTTTASVSSPRSFQRVRDFVDVKFLSGKTTVGITVEGGDLMVVKSFESHSDDFNIIDSHVTDIEVDQGMRVGKAGSDKFVVVGRKGGTIELAVGVITSNGNIDMGTSITVPNGSGYNDIEYLEDDRVVLLDGRNGWARVIDIDDLTPTFNTEYTFTANEARQSVLSVVSPNKFTISYADQGNSNFGTTVVGEITSGSVINYGSSAVFINEGMDDRYRFESAKVDSSTIAVSYAKNDGSGVTKVGSITGNSITFGSENQFQAAAQNVLRTSITGWDGEGNGYVAYVKNPSNHVVEVQVANISGTTMTFTGSVTTVSSETNTSSFIDITSLYNASWIIGYESNDSIGHFNQGVYYTTDEREDFIGFTKEAGTAGEVKPVFLISDIADGFSGLIPNQEYYLDPLLNVTETRTGFFVGLAVDDDAILLQRNYDYVIYG